MSVQAPIARLARQHKRVSMEKEKKRVASEYMGRDGIVEKEQGVLKGANMFKMHCTEFSRN